MTDIFGSEQEAVEQEPEVEQTSGSRFAPDDGVIDGDRASDVVDAEVVDDEFDDATTEVISGSAPKAAGVEQALAQRDEYLDSLRRLQAEFANYKKRVAKQQSDQVARAAQSLVEKLLPVLDTLDLATSHIRDFESDDGRALMAASGQLRDVLIKEGLERIDPLGEEFDPNTHEAVGHLPDEEGPGSGQAEVVRRPVPRSSRWWPRSCDQAIAGAAPWCVRPW